MEEAKEKEEAVKSKARKLGLGFGFIKIRNITSLYLFIGASASQPADC